MPEENFETKGGPLTFVGGHLDSRVLSQFVDTQLASMSLSISEGASTRPKKPEW
jgi:hypothetical protein